MTLNIMIFGFAAVSMVFLTPVAVLVTIFYFTPLRRATASVMYKIAQGWAFIIIRMLRCDLTVRGLENRVNKGSVCFVSNHSGILDILLLLAFAGRPFGFIAKRELSYIPFLNMWILVMGGLFIDRKNPRKSFRTINKGVRRIEKNGAMLIFPEGTRSRGLGVLPFKAGALKLAARSGALIIPVAISGSYEMFERQHSIVRGKALIAFGAPINTAKELENGGTHLLAAKVQRVVENMLAQ